jgi:hypothetical protein
MSKATGNSKTSATSAPVPCLIDSMQAARDRYDAVIQNQSLPWRCAIRRGGRGIFRCIGSLLQPHVRKQDRTSGVSLSVFEQRMQEEVTEVQAWGEDSVSPPVDLFEIANAAFRNINAVLA